MIRIGMVGVGFIGMIHFLAYRKVQGAKVVALCERDKKRLSGDWTGLRGNFGPPGEKMDLSGVKPYEELDRLLADPDVDLIDICTPTHLHAPMVLAALKAGKNVLVEKPIALKVEDADAMVAAARASGTLFMVAQVLPFFPEFGYAADAVRSGRYGKLLGGHLTRVISQPDWSADIADASKTGGPAVDLHIHDTHFLAVLAGMPKQVFANGILAADGSVDYLTTNYLYGPSGPALSCSSGIAATKGRPFTHGFELYLEQATLAHNASLPLTVYGADGTTQVPELGSGDPIDSFARELQAAVESVRAGKPHDNLRGDVARDALALSYRECESVRTGQVVGVH